jgi:hypothetical protein
MKRTIISCRIKLLLPFSFTSLLLCAQQGGSLLVLSAITFFKLGMLQRFLPSEEDGMNYD